MKGIPISRLKPARLGRRALVLGGVAAVMGASLITGGIAKADIGGGPGLTISPGSGNGTVVPTYNSPACPAGFNGSAKVSAVADDGTEFQVAPANNAVAAAFSGTFSSNANMANVFANAYVTTTPAIPAVEELVVDCFASPSLVGAVNHAFDGWVIWNAADGSAWTFSATKPVGVGPASTTTTLSASPNPATTGATITLTAHVTAAGGATPAGTVTFSTGGSAIGSPVTVNSTGTATTTDSFSTGGTVQFTAAFTPTDSTKFSPSTSSPFSENVIGGLSEPLQVTVGATGTFSVTVTSGTVTLTPNAGQTSATGTAQPVNVFDNRNNFPGWSVSGQAANFTESTSPKPGSIPASNLGWTPTGTLTDATLGPVVAPGTTGLSTAQVWASAASGHGNTAAAGDNISANFLLNIPSGSPAATYNSALSISFTTAGA
jgi:hypothetical protein